MQNNYELLPYSAPHHYVQPIECVVAQFWSSCCPWQHCLLAPKPQLLGTPVLLPARSKLSLLKAVRLSLMLLVRQVCNRTHQVDWSASTDALSILALFKIPARWCYFVSLDQMVCEVVCAHG